MSVLAVANIELPRLQSMRQSIELGRAVLSTSTINFELWLKTLITISPQQECTNIEQHDATSLLELLSSGEAWVGRGNGLYIDLDLTLRGQPFADEQLQQLSEAILAAPVWVQLNLQPSLPLDTTHEPGKLRIAVNHSSECALSPVKQHHRVLSNVSASDLRPPKGVSAFSLNSILLHMDVFETVQRRKRTTGKRLKISSTNSNIALQPTTSEVVDDLEQETLDELPFEAQDAVSLPASPPNSKRNRSTASFATRTASLPVIPPYKASDKCPLTVKIANSHNSTPRTNVSVNISDLQTLIDGALRLSVTSSINSKSVPGIKVKANTFGPGLAEIAPVLWRPGYLLSLSQRANLLSVISRSLCQPAVTGRTTSISLRSKLSALTVPLPSFQAADPDPEPRPASASDGGFLTSSVALRLWLHLQKNVPCKSATLLQSFVTAELQPTTHFQSDDMLDQFWVNQDHRSRPRTMGPDRNGASSVNHTCNDHPAMPAVYESTPSKQQVFGVLAASNHILTDVDDKPLFGDEFSEPLSSTVRYNIEVPEN